VYPNSIGYVGAGVAIGSIVGVVDSDVLNVALDELEVLEGIVGVEVLMSLLGAALGEVVAC
jgi:hypothetical protein